MEAWEIEQAVADRFHREWEAANAEDENAGTLRLAAQSLGLAINVLDKAADRVSEVADLLTETPEGNKAGQILEQMESILAELKAMKEAME